jgi:hypothetical protein
MHCGTTFGLDRKKSPAERLCFFVYLSYKKKGAESTIQPKTMKIIAQLLSVHRYSTTNEIVLQEKMQKSLV